MCNRYAPSEEELSEMGYEIPQLPTTTPSNLEQMEGERSKYIEGKLFLEKVKEQIAIERNPMINTSLKPELMEMVESNYTNENE